MQCHEFELRVQELLDERHEQMLNPGRLPRDLRAHAASCDECRRELAGYRDLLVGLQAMAKTTAASMPARAVRRGGLHRQTLAGLSTAAVLVLSAWLAVRWQPTVAPAPEVVVRAVVPASQLVPPSAAPSDAGRAVTPMMSPSVLVSAFEGPTHAFNDQPAMLEARHSRLELDPMSVGVMLRLAGLSPVSFSAEVLEAHLAQQPGWLVQVSDGLKPVTERMSGTLNALLRALPGGSISEEENQGARNGRSNPYNQTA